MIEKLRTKTELERLRTQLVQVEKALATGKEAYDAALLAAKDDVPDLAPLERKINRLKELITDTEETLLDHEAKSKERAIIQKGLYRLGKAHIKRAEHVAKIHNALAEIEHHWVEYTKTNSEVRESASLAGIDLNAITRRTMATRHRRSDAMTTSVLQIAPSLIETLGVGGLHRTALMKGGDLERFEEQIGEFLDAVKAQQQETSERPKVRERSKAKT